MNHEYGEITLNVERITTYEVENASKNMKYEKAVESSSITIQLKKYGIQKRIQNCEAFVSSVQRRPCFKKTFVL